MKSYHQFGEVELIFPFFPFTSSNIRIYEEMSCVCFECFLSVCVITFTDKAILCMLAVSGTLSLDNTLLEAVHSQQWTVHGILSKKGFLGLSDGCFPRIQKDF